ncbi:MAG: hypothetical protein ACRCXM_15740 [Beijerinckiaceae bacterium]
MRNSNFLYLGMTALLAGCASDAPQKNDIVAALERAHLADVRIPLDRIRSAECQPAANVFQCEIVYIAPKKTDAQSGIDRLARMRLEIERVGKIWRVGKITPT